MSLNIIFAGTPDFSAAQLQALINSKHNIIGVYTQPDRPAKRGKKVQASPVKTLAQQHNLKVFQPINFKEQASLDELKGLQPDLMIVVAYGLLLPESVLNIPRYGCINVHASLLPRWRGAAPIQRAIQAGDEETGITIMQMDKGLDTGDMLAKSTLTISKTDTALTLHDKLADISQPLLLSTIESVEKQTLKPEKQDDEYANYAAKLSKQEALIDWQMSAEALALNIRAFNPAPMCYCFVKTKRLRVMKARLKRMSESELTQNWTKTPSTIASLEQGVVWVATQEGWLGLEEIQLEGKRAMHSKELINGQPDLFMIGESLN